MSGLFARKAMQAFPAWQKAGWDPSSNSARLLRALMDPVEVERSNAIHEHKDEFLFKNWLHKAEVYSVALDEADAYVKISGNWLGKTVTGDAEQLSEVTTVTELMKGYDRGLRTITLNDPVTNVLFSHEGIWSEEPPDNFEDEINSIEETLVYPNHLTLQVSGGRFSRPRANKQTTGVATFQIVGRDINNVTITETLSFAFNDAKKSHHIYKYVDKVIGNESRSLDWKLLLTPEVGIKQEHPFLSAHGRETDSPLYLNVRVEEDKSFLQYYVRTSFSAEVEELDAEEAFELLHETRLLRAESNIIVNNWFIHPENGYVYASTNDWVLIFEPRLPEFVPPTHANLISYNSLMGILPERSFSTGEMEHLFHAHLLHPSTGITKIFVYLINPNRDVLFLQEDKTWDVGEYSFNANRKQYDDWQDIRFGCEMEDPGQWEFYVQCTVDRMTTLSYTGVFVDVQEPISEISAENTGIVLLRGHKLLLLLEEETRECELLKLSYLADKENNTLYFADAFTEIEVS